MLLMKRIFMLFCAIFLLNVVIACQQQEGPAEEAGRKIDKTIEKAGKKMEEAGDKIKKETQN
jgi:outer membrane lipoprotein-sorting protein